MGRKRDKTRQDRKRPGSYNLKYWYPSTYSGEYICLPLLWRSPHALNNPVPRRAAGPSHTIPVSPSPRLQNGATSTENGGLLTPQFSITVPNSRWALNRHVGGATASLLLLILCSCSWARSGTTGLIGQDVDPRGSIEVEGEQRCVHCNWIANSESALNRHARRCAFKPVRRPRNSVVGRMATRTVANERDRERIPLAREDSSRALRIQRESRGNYTQRNILLLYPPFSPPSVPRP
jgi:hypothetical protein